MVVREASYLSAFNIHSSVYYEEYRDGCLKSNINNTSIIQGEKVFLLLNWGMFDVYLGRFVLDDLLLHSIFCVKQWGCGGQIHEAI